MIVDLSEDQLNALKHVANSQKFDAIVEDPVLGFHISCCRSFPLQFRQKKQLLSKIYEWSKKANISDKVITFNSLSIYFNDDKSLFYLALDCKNVENSLPHYLTKKVQDWLKDLNLKSSTTPFEEFRLHMSFSTSTKIKKSIEPHQTSIKLGELPENITDWNLHTGNLYCKIGSTKIFKIVLS
jgi:hypothetical protein